MNRTKRLAVIAGLGAAVAGGLVVPAAAWAADPTPSASSSATSGTTADTGERGPRGGHGGRGLHATELAKALGIDEAKVTAALRELRESGGTDRPAKDGQPPTEAEREAARQKMAEALAAKLGVTADKITSALNALQQQRAAKAEAALSERLKTAVTAGTLTQAEADAVLKAHKAGLLGGGRGAH
ncbi:hypothetical protein [Planomonospora venezuelensis]|uniref:DNA-binding transcriptional ArsR family regulator n=1 Tax=Planomonospora venezuelensis TaxID=1999 RepID=A0A841DBS8_PLAVE|nr:hypothetical protein [Planomonospora venezuelensis]MBB5966273.1 DNA-binding transcriptional ArsR family regulator [Planomonospora venezuelensis]GIM98420.1 hypothetical protein Pve01_00790 [Planomonospora venezuelensis]